MLMSMTGFGRGESRVGGKTYQVEMKSVNHRYCDISVKLPKQISFLEERIREYVSKSTSRGKVDVYVAVNEYGDESRTVLLDEYMAKAYIDALNVLKERCGLQGDISIDLVARLPDVLRAEKACEDEEKIWQDFKPALECAIDCLIAMRRKEGEDLKKSIIEYCDAIFSRLGEIERRAPEVVREYKLKLENRIKELVSEGTADENRLAMEVAIYADRCCIDEEIVRLKSHLKQLKAAFESDQPVGRKLDFLVQEINREANTIASKSTDVGITMNIVEIKGEIEKIREQIQNIE